MKFKRGGPGISLDVGYSVHNAILVRVLVSCHSVSYFKFKRRFARENPTVIGVEEVEGEDDDSFEDSRSSPAPPTKKRKLSTQTQGGGRIPKGKDFWSQVDTFFTKKITEFGTKNLQNAGWKEYVHRGYSSGFSLTPCLDTPRIPFGWTRFISQRSLTSRWMLSCLRRVPAIPLAVKAAVSIPLEITRY